MAIVPFLSDVFRKFVAGIFIALLAPIDSFAEVTVTTIDGAQLHGILQAWDANGLVVTVNGERRVVDAERLLGIRWDNKQTPIDTDFAMLELTDGSRLPASNYITSGGEATIETPLVSRPLSIPTRDIRRVEFAPLADPTVARWREFEEKELTGDVLFIRKKKTSEFDHLAGVLGDVSAKDVSFEWDDDLVRVKRAKVAALIYYHARLPELPVSACRLTTGNGARLFVASIALDGAYIDLTTTGGVQFRIPLESLQQADCSAGKLVYLSDLEPETQSWVPRIELPESAKLLQQFGKLRQDQSLSGSAISLAWPAESESASSDVPHGRKTYPKGLALRSRSELVYRLPPNMQRFIAIAGIDPATADQGNVMLTISADRQVIWQGEIAGGESPVEINVDVGGARLLRIFVDYGPNLDYGDRLHLADAKVTK